MPPVVLANLRLRDGFIIAVGSVLNAIVAVSNLVSYGILCRSDETIRQRFAGFKSGKRSYFFKEERMPVVVYVTFSDDHLRKDSGRVCSHTKKVVVSKGMTGTILIAGTKVNVVEQEVNNEEGNSVEVDRVKKERKKVKKVLLVLLNHLENSD